MIRGARHGRARALAVRSLILTAFTVLGTPVVSARLRPRRSGNVWLSATPEILGSIGWDSGHTRMVTWALFADLATGRDFYAVNTHLDNRSEQARRRAASLIKQRLATFEPLPIVLTGDFNTPAKPSSQVYHLLVDRTGLQDSWTTAPRHGPPYACGLSRGVSRASAI